MTQSEKTVKKMGAISLFDRLVMTVAFWALCTLAGAGLLRFIRATDPMQYVIAGAAVGFLIYALLSPLMRKV